LITGDRDPVAIAAIVQPPTQQYAANLTTQQVDTGHWAHIEAADQVNQNLLAFFQQIGTKNGTKLSSW
jgi:pimeloyl-ACP methyl ester carboxylesterase